MNNLTPDEELYIKAKRAYYKGEPIMSDPEFDALEDHLRELDSFVLDIVGTGSKKKSMIAHPTPMGSLTKIQFTADYTPYKEFCNWMDKMPANCVLGFDLKMDGNAINCVYENGVLVKVLSRGDGAEGQDHTGKMNIPTRIKGFSGEIRGEAVIDQFLFEDKYKKSDDASLNTDLKKYTNARNFVAGMLNKDKSDKMKEVYSELDFIAFEIVGFTGNTRSQLIAWGFDVPTLSINIPKSRMSEYNFIDLYKRFKSFREDESKYQLDGIVCKIDEAYREEVGKTSHHPLWALAIKFETDKAVTTIESIEWNLGKRGQLTPVAILKPVNLMDSTVSRASLYNADWMVKNRCYPGAKVSLVKSGDIIPKIVEILKPSDETFAYPTDWNGNGVKFNGVHLMVDNFQDTDEFKTVQLHSSAVSLGIDGIGPSTAEKLVKAGIDLKTLLSETPDGLRMILINSGQYKDGRDLEILIENVFALTKVELWQVIYAMNFDKCGRTISKQLANWLVGIKHSFDRLERAVVEKFVQGKDQRDQVKEIVTLLRSNNVQVIDPVNEADGLVTFEMTGEPTTHATKKEFVRDVEKNGKCKHTSLGKDTTYLITNSKAATTGKMAKAEKQGTKIVTYDEFLVIAENL